MKKKKFLLTYSLVSFIINFIVTVVTSPFIIFSLCYLRNGRILEFQKGTLKNKIDGGLGLVLFWGVCIFINILVYKVITKKLKLQKRYLFFPIGIMLLATFFALYSVYIFYLI